MQTQSTEYQAGQNNAMARSEQSQIDHLNLESGVIRLVKLQQDGRLQKGDTVATKELGNCEVVTIQDRNSITVKNPSGQHFLLSGLGFKGRVVPH